MIGWKRLIIPCLLIVLIVGITFIKEFCFDNIIQTSISQSTPYKTYFEPSRPSEGSLEELYQDVFMTMLLPYINKAVDDYYEKNTGYSPSVDLWQPKILYIERPNGYRTFLFNMKLEIAPYLGAHISVGVDHITLRVSSQKVEVEKFEHIKSYPIPPCMVAIEP